MVRISNMTKKPITLPSMHVIAPNSVLSIEASVADGDNALPLKSLSHAGDVSIERDPETEDQPEEMKPATAAAKAQLAKPGKD